MHSSPMLVIFCHYQTSPREGKYRKKNRISGSDAPGVFDELSGNRATTHAPDVDDNNKVLLSDVFKSFPSLSYRSGVTICPQYHLEARYRKSKLGTRPHDTCDRVALVFPPTNTLCSELYGIAHACA